MPDRTQYTIAEILDMLRDISLWLPDEELGSDSEFLRMSIEVFMGDWDIEQWTSNRERKSFFTFLSRHFDFERPWPEWKHLMTCDATVGQLAAFIADHAPRYAIRPRNILGRDCLEAGIMAFLNHETHRITGHMRPVRPSTRLDQALNQHQQEQLATRLARHFPTTLHSDSGLLREKSEPPYIAISMAVAFIPAVFLCWPPAWNQIFSWLQAVLTFGVLFSPLPLILSFLISKFIEEGRSTFAPTINTYRDLAKFLAAQPHRRNVDSPAPQRGEPYTPSEILALLHRELSDVICYRYRTEAEFAAARIDLFTHEPEFGCTSPKNQRLNFLVAMKRKFRFRCEEDDWMPLLGPEATMGDLAAFIAERATHETIRPRRILGRTCLEAGIFQFLQEKTTMLTGRSRRIGPSTPLPEALSRSQLRKLADHANTFFPGINARNSKLWRAGMLRFETFLLGVVGFTTAALAGLPLLVESGLRYYVLGILIIGPVAAFALRLLMHAIAFCLGKKKTPFARTIRTYRDLVKFLAAHDRRQFVRCEPA